jgi:hypothetical protein
MSTSIIQIKYSVLSQAPTELLRGELAYSQISGKLFIGDDSNLPVEIGGADLVARVGSVETAVGLLQTDLATAQSAITSLEADHQSQETAIAALQASIAALEAASESDLQAAITSLQASIAATKQHITTVSDRVSTIESDLQSQITMADVTITGDLIVQGTTTRVDSTVETIQDPVITIASDTGEFVDGMDRGIEYKYYDADAGEVKTGFFGVNQTTGRFTFIKDAANPSDNKYTGQAAEVEFGSMVSGNVQASGSTNTITGYSLIEGKVDGSGNPASTLRNFIIDGGTF